MLTAHIGGACKCRFSVECLASSRVRESLAARLVNISVSRVGFFFLLGFTLLSEAIRKEWTRYESSI